jgi:hypothetical protein
MKKVVFTIDEKFMMMTVIDIYIEEVEGSMLKGKQLRAFNRLKKLRIKIASL